MWGTFTGTVQIPPEGFLRLFLKPSSSVSRVHHTALTHCTHHHHQQFLHASHLVCTLLSHIFICYLRQILQFSHVVHFCIAWLLSSRFWGWFIWKVAAFRLQEGRGNYQASSALAELKLRSWSLSIFCHIKYICGLSHLYFFLSRATYLFCCTICPLGIAAKRFLWAAQEQTRGSKQNTIQINSSNTHSTKGCIKIDNWWQAGISEGFQILRIYELPLLSKPTQQSYSVHNVWLR